MRGLNGLNGANGHASFIRRVSKGRTMRQRTVLAAVAFVAVTLALVGVGSVAALQDDPGNETNGNASVGASVSAFMQASAAQTEGEVDRGMWEAAFERANESERARLVHEREAELSARADRLERQRDELPGQASDVAAVARAAAFEAESRSLSVSVDSTSEAARRANVDAPGLDELKERAKGLEKKKPPVDLPDVVDTTDTTDAPGKGNGNGNDRTPPGQNRTTTAVPTGTTGTPGPPDDPGNGNGGAPTDRPGNGNDGQGPPTDRGTNRTTVTATVDPPVTYTATETTTTSTTEEDDDETTGNGNDDENPGNGSDNGNDAGQN